MYRRMHQHDRINEQDVPESQVKIENFDLNFLQYVF